ncbi:hypothetical protein JCM3774_005575 [Rhodotorula dairenensis]
MLPTPTTSQDPRVAFVNASDATLRPADRTAANDRIVDLADAYHLFETIPPLLPPHTTRFTSAVPPPEHNVPLLPVQPDSLGPVGTFQTIAAAWCDSPQGREYCAKSELAAARRAALTGGEAFAAELGQGVDEHVVVIEDDSDEGRRELQQRMERTVFGVDALPTEWDATAECWKSVAGRLPFLHRIRPGHAVLSAPESKPINYRLQSAYLTSSSNRVRIRTLRSALNASDPRVLAAALALESIEVHHPAAIQLANDPRFRLADGSMVCWLALQPLLSPSGNGKGNSSFSISFTRRDLAEGVIAPAASVASAADFERVFTGCTDVAEQFERYVDTHTKINARLAEVTKAVYIATLPRDAQEALLVRHHVHGTASDGLDNYFTHHRQLNSRIYPLERASTATSLAPGGDPLEGDMSLQLGLRFGIVHDDEKDDEAAFSVLIPLGILPPGAHMGTFLDARSGSYIEWDAADLGVFIFRGTDSHVGTPATLPPVYPAPPAGGIYSRSVVVAYPSRLAVQPDAPVAVDAHDLLATRGLLRGFHSGIPIALVIISSSSSVDSIAFTTTKASVVSLRSTTISEHSLSTRPRRTWSLETLIARGNPFGFVPDEPSSMWTSQLARSAALARADDYFRIAAESVISGRTMVQAAKASDRGIDFAWGQAWVRPVLSTEPASLKQYLDQANGPLSTAQIIAAAVTNNLSTIDIEVSLGDWTRDLTRTPKLPVPPQSVHDSLFTGVPQGKRIKARRRDADLVLARQEELTGVFSRVSPLPSLPDLPRFPAATHTGAPPAAPFPSSAEPCATLSDSIQHVSGADIASAVYAAVASDCDSSFGLLHAIALALVANTGVFLRNVVWPQVVLFVETDGFAASETGAVVLKHLHDPTSTPVPIPLLGAPRRHVCLPHRPEQNSAERRCAIAIFDLVVLTLFATPTCVINNDDVDSADAATLLAKRDLAAESLRAASASLFVNSSVASAAGSFAVFLSPEVRNMCPPHPHAAGVGRRLCQSQLSHERFTSSSSFSIWSAAIAEAVKATLAADGSPLQGLLDAYGTAAQSSTHEYLRMLTAAVGNGLLEPWPTAHEKSGGQQQRSPAQLDIDKPKRSRRRKPKTVSGDPSTAEIQAARRFSNVVFSVGCVVAQEAQEGTTDMQLPPTLRNAITNLEQASRAAKTAPFDRIKEKLRTAPYTFQPHREAHPHRLHKPSFTVNDESASNADRLEHTVRVRLGLIGAQDEVYEAFPALGIGAGRLNGWLEHPRVKPYYDRRCDEGGGGWGRINAYGQPCKQLAWDACCPAITPAKIAELVLELGSCADKTFSQALKALQKASLPACQTAGTLSAVLLAGDIALEGLAPAPAFAEMGAIVATLSKGAIGGLRHLGFLRLDDLPLPEDHANKTAYGDAVASRVTRAFVRFASVMNDPDPTVSGISPELRVHLDSIGFDLGNAIFLENTLCKVYREKWGSLRESTWITATGLSGVQLGWINMDASGWKLDI